MARPRKIETAEDLQRNINAYFDSVDEYNKNNKEDKKYYTWPDLLLFLNIVPSTVETWISNPDNYVGFKDVINIAQLKLQSQIEQLGFCDGKKTGIVAFMLKQKHYGGYTDKPVSAADSINVKVDLTGMGHKDAFG